ncbi:hypothetical protein PTKIN_Ptkin16aG0010900 [Pterospermum kingtungense]
MINILPTCDNLVVRRVTVENICPVCRGDSESVFHLFVDCSYAKCCWYASPVGYRRGSCQNFADWLQFLFNHMFSSDLAIVVLVIWQLWSHRNLLVWKDKSSSPSNLVQSSLSFLQHWSEAQASVKSAIQKSSMQSSMQQDDMRTVDKWTGPPSGWLKCNVDASVVHSTSVIGSGCVIRDSHGSFTATRAVSQQCSILYPSVAEAISFREAFSWLKDLRMESVIVETDALVVVNAVQYGLTTDSYFGMIIDDCISIIKEIPYYKVSFVRRSVNRVSHVLARASVSMFGLRVWHLVPPNFICDVLNNDNE